MGIKLHRKKAKSIRNRVFVEREYNLRTEASPKLPFAVMTPHWTKTVTTRLVRDGKVINTNVKWHCDDGPARCYILPKYNSEKDFLRVEYEYVYSFFVHGKQYEINDFKTRFLDDAQLLTMKLEYGI